MYKHACGTCMQRKQVQAEKGCAFSISVVIYIYGSILLFRCRIWRSFIFVLVRGDVFRFYSQALARIDLNYSKTPKKYVSSFCLSWSLKMTPSSLCSVEHSLQTQTSFAVHTESLESVQGRQIGRMATRMIFTRIRLNHRY